MKCVSVLLIVVMVYSPSVHADNFGQLLMAYYSGIGQDTLGSGGVNALALAFFDPGPLGSGVCDFTNTGNAPCLKPAAGSGDGKNLAWAVNIIQGSYSALSGNTSPKRGGKPTVFFSFGGQSQGGAVWDSLFSSAGTATNFGQNAARLVTQVYKTVGEKVYIGFDLDVEGTSTHLPNIGAFVKAFRALAPYDTFPLQLCTLSGVAKSDNPDNFKVSIMQQWGPSAQGINFLNMMVNNVDSSCNDMSAYWRDPALNFLPAGNKILGIWGETISAWVLHGPGCTDGSDPLFTWMKKNGVGIGIWQWWSGSTNEITSLINQVRAG